MNELVIGIATSPISGSLFFALIKESFLSATFGLICSGSLSAERPLMFNINLQFVAGDEPLRLKWWNSLCLHSLRRSRRHWALKPAKLRVCNDLGSV